MTKILLVDDEAQFRTSLAGRLRKRGFDILDVDGGEEAIKAARKDDGIEVAVIDLKMPKMDGIQTLRELKAVRPALQAIMLTGHGTLESAKDAGRHDAFRYLQKPCDVDEVIQALEAATEEVGYARDRHEIPRPLERRSVWRMLIGSHNSRPGFVVLGLAIFAAIVYGPTPARLLHLLGAPKSAPEAATAARDEIMGYAAYREMAPGQTIANYYGRKYKIQETTSAPDGSTVTGPVSPGGTAKRAKVMLAVIVVGALFWASGAVPVAVTTFFVALALYLFDVFKPDAISQAFAKDAVIFIFGVLALAKAITKTGLDRRIGLLLLAPAKNLPLLLLVFLPMFSVACSFISEHAMVAFTMPLFVMVYASAIKTAGLKRDRMLMVMFTLAIAYAANSGGPGSPAAGGRNAIMVGILADYGMTPTFGQWMSYGLPLVPVMSFVIGLYFLLVVRHQAQIKTLNVAAEVRRAADKIGPMTRDEYITGAIFSLVILLWVTCSGWLGMGGPVLVGLVLLNLFRVLSWKDMQGIHWEVVLLYAGACAIGSGLAATGAALYMADAFVAMLPGFLATGTGLAIASSLFTGITTNFMSDGATVAAIGPVTVPMATVAGTHPWMVGLTTAFASSFAHTLIIGTPSNALAYAMAKDPETGEQLVTLGDFMKHGLVVLALSFLVLWGWAILGYWRWIGFPVL
jgi:sodium-dependent dicarboxylate transporter 2/3/5